MFDFKTYYENFSLDNPTVSLTVIMWAICIGLAIGTVFYAITKYASGSLVKKLSAGEHLSCDSAVTAAELGIKPSLLLKRALRENQPLRKYVVIANPDECIIEKEKKGFFNGIYKFFRGEDVPPKYDLAKAKLYIPEDVKHTAQLRYETKGSPVISVIIACVVFFLIGVGLSYSMPKLLDLVDSMLTAYKNLR